MSVETALMLAASEKPVSNSAGMELTNQYFEMLNPNTWETVFPPCDIQLCKFYEQAELSERERDMVYIVNFLHQCYSELHVTVLSLNEQLSPASIARLYSIFEKLQKYNLTNILLNDKITEEQFITIMAEQ